MQCRLEKAKQLLSTSDLPIIEICFQTGFKTQSHFTTLFHKLTGQTPKTWREENRTVFLSTNSNFRT
jgi:AraC family transcriptional regulator